MNETIQNFMGELASRMCAKLLSRGELKELNEKIFSFSKEESKYIMLHLTPVGDDCSLSSWENVDDISKKRFTTNYRELMLVLPARETEILLSKETS